MKRCLRHACGFALSCLLAIPPARAAVWTGSGGDAFGSTSSWSTGVVPSGSSSIAEFGGNTGGTSIVATHTVGTLYFRSDYASGGFTVRNGGNLTLITGIVNDSTTSPFFTIRDGLLYFTGNAPQLGDGVFNIETAGTLKLFSENNPDGSAARINLLGGKITLANPAAGGSISLGEVKGTSGSIFLGSTAVTVGAVGTDATFSGVIELAGSLTKVGAGTWTLTGANTYAGTTLISGGTIKINNSTGSAFGTGAVTIGTAGTLTGAGSFTGALQNDGTYAPGNSPTLAALSSFSQGSTGILEMEIAGLVRGTGFDALDVTGALTFGGTLQVSFIDGFTGSSLVAGTTFNLFDWGSASGSFSSLSLPDLSAYGLAWDTSDLYTTGELSVSAIPEPSTYAALAGLAALGLAFWQRHRRSRKAPPAHRESVTQCVTLPR